MTKRNTIANAEARAAPHPRLTSYYTDESERRTLIRDTFNDTAQHYDVINRLMSFGTDVSYRRDALKRGGIKAGMAVLDIGCGTGMISMLASQSVGEEGRVVGVDPSIGMLSTAVANKRVRLPVNGRAECLPFADASFDFVCMSYALRHVDDLNETFAEYARVLKKDGKLLILEMTPPERGWSFSMLKFYLKRIVPLATRLATGSPDAKLLYEYCWDTFEHCVPPADILGALSNAGLERAERDITLKIFSEYRAQK